MDAKFTQSLKIGREREIAVVAAFENELELLDGKAGDIRIKATGAKVELKSESRTLQQTRNVFLERWRDEACTKNGGVWQACEHGCERFAVMFGCGTILLYDSQRLAELAEAWIVETSRKPFQAWTIGTYERYCTVGYPVPREAVAPALLKVLAMPANVLPA